MPGYDRTGPMGQGPMTGRGMGSCPKGFGRGPGYRRGFGRGFGFRQRFTKTEEKEFLQEDLKELESETKAVKERLSELGK